MKPWLGTSRGGGLACGLVTSELACSDQVGSRAAGQALNAGALVVPASGGADGRATGQAPNTGALVVPASNGADGRASGQAPNAGVLVVPASGGAMDTTPQGHHCNFSAVILLSTRSPNRIGKPFCRSL